MIELRPQFPLPFLLRAAGLARSTFYYQQAALKVADKYSAMKDQIKAIYEQHKGRYGYRRITATLRRQGCMINHKTVQRLMNELHLKSIVRLKKSTGRTAGMWGRLRRIFLRGTSLRPGQTRNGRPT